MTIKQAKAAGWKITGTGSDMTAEKGRLIYMGSEALILTMIRRAVRK